MDWGLMTMINLTACKFLDFSKSYEGCQLTACKQLPSVKYWLRDAPYEGAATKVQFCKKYGRINSMLQCYGVNGIGCYEPEE